MDPSAAPSRSSEDFRTRGSAYERSRARITGLVAGIGDEGATTPVPACPAWSVHDVLAHLAGVCADVMAGNVVGAATDEWTAAQVTARKAHTLAELLEEWDEVGPQLASRLDDFPGLLGAQVVADVTTHEHDIRGALRRPGARNSDGVAIGLEFLVAGWLHGGLSALGLGPLEVRANGRSWIAGTGRPPGGDLQQEISSAVLGTATPPPAGAAPAGVLTAPAFELFRAITGRRTVAQIRRFEWTIDPARYVDAFGLDFFSVRTTELEE